MKYLLILLVAFISIDCSPKLAPDYSWSRQRWVLVEMKEVPVQQSGSRRDAYINFEINDRKFTGSGGCNQISGNYTIDKNEIKFSDVVSTKMNCIDIEFENVFITTLNAVDRYEQRGNDIILKRKREKLLVLRSY